MKPRKLADPLKQLAAAEALEWLQQLADLPEDGLEESILQMVEEEHQAAVVITDALIVDNASKILDAVSDAIKTGKIPEKFDSDAGLRQLITTGMDNHDPRVAFQATLRTAYAAGREQRIDEDDRTTHLLYRSMQDGRVRDSHAKLNGTVLPKGDPFWKSFSPPLGWRCRCTTIPLDARGVDKLRAKGAAIKEVAPEFETNNYVNKKTGAVSKVPEGVTPGFEHKKSSKEGLRVLKDALEYKINWLKAGR